MAERLMLVCDVCGNPAAETVTFKTSAGNRQKDYCSRHLQDLVQGSRVPKRGRKPGSTNAKKTTATRKPRKAVKRRSTKTTAARRRSTRSAKARPAK